MRRIKIFNARADGRDVRPGWKRGASDAHAASSQPSRRERERLRKSYLAALRWLVHDPEADLGQGAPLLARLLEEAPFDVDAVKLRLESLMRELRTSDAAAEYDRWRNAYRASIGSEAPGIWHRPLCAER